MLAGTTASRTLWTISRCEGGRLEVLTAEDGVVLPVFGFEEEAALYLRFEAPEDEGWKARKVTSGELVSLLCACCRGARFVSLDPLPREFGLSFHPYLTPREEFLRKLAPRPKAVRSAPLAHVPLPSASGF